MTKTAALLQDSAYEYIREKITRGELDPDKIYSVKDVANTLNMSKTPVRDAVMKLSREDLIEILPSRGFRLQQYDDQSMRELFQLRQALEGYAGAVLAIAYAKHPDIPEIPQLEHQMALQRDALARGVSVDEFLTIESEFHWIILRSVRNSRIESVMNNNHRFYREYALHSLMQENILEQTLEEHQHILDSIKEGNATKTWDAIATHLLTPYEKNLEEHGEKRAIEISREYVPTFESAFIPLRDILEEG